MQRVRRSSHPRSRLDLLLVIKPRLGEAKRSAWSLLIPDRDKVAAQAEAISQQRPKSNKDWQDVADALDREGARLFGGICPES